MTTTHTPPKLWPLGAMAHRLGVKSRDLRAEAEAGRVPCVRVGGGSLLFSPSAVEAALIERAGEREAAR